MASALEVRLVVFDWSGTTVDFGSRAPAGAFVAAFAERGVAVTLAEARGPMGLHKKDHLRAMLRTPEVGAKWRTNHGRDWAEADVEDLYRLVTPLQLAAATEYGALVPGVRECVAELRRRGIKVGASTGYFREAAEACYTVAAQQGYAPDYSICADEVPAGRPAPWMVFRVMERLGVYPPAGVVKIGDTVIDIEDGRNAGAWSVGVVDSSNEMALSEAEFVGLGYTDREARRAAVRARFEAAGAHEVVNTLAELPALVDELNARLANGDRP